MSHVATPANDNNGILGNPADLPFTVVAITTDTGRIVVHHVFAKGPYQAYPLVAQYDSGLGMVIALPGHLGEDVNFWLPGEGVVDSADVLDWADGSEEE